MKQTKLEKLKKDFYRNRYLVFKDKQGKEWWDPDCVLRFIETEVSKKDEEILQAFDYHSNSGLDISFPAYMGWRKDPEVGTIVSGGKKYIREDLIETNPTNKGEKG